MCKKQKSRHKRKFGRKKQRRYRRFWRQVTAERYDKILGFARRFTKDITDAHDLAQTVVWRLLQYCPNPVGVINVDAYIWASTRHLALDLRRRQKEISFSNLRKKDSPQLAVPDPNIMKFMEECDVKALAQNTVDAKSAKTNPLVLQIQIWVREGYKLPAIAKRLNVPVRTVRYRWYQHLNAQKKVFKRLPPSAPNETTGESRRPARVRRVPACAPIASVR